MNKIHNPIYIDKKAKELPSEAKFKGHWQYATNLLCWIKAFVAKP